MNNFDGAPLKDAFKIIGEGSKKTMKQKDKVVPRDKEVNDLNKINFEENLKFIIERYDKVINNLIDEINVLKSEKAKPNKKLVEGFTNMIPNFSENQINDLIFLLFSGIFIILLMNYLCKK
tara:strand:+ start:725 stop:1087 length:363 start_codon:yes stop_codon:yes gene_type:complete